MRLGRRCICTPDVSLEFLRPRASYTYVRYKFHNSPRHVSGRYIRTSSIVTRQYNNLYNDEYFITTVYT